MVIYMLQQCTLATIGGWVLYTCKCMCVYTCVSLVHHIRDTKQGYYGQFTSIVNGCHLWSYIILSIMLWLGQYTSYMYTNESEGNKKSRFIIKEVNTGFHVRSPPYLFLLDFSYHQFLITKANKAKLSISKQ